MSDYGVNLNIDENSDCNKSKEIADISTEYNECVDRLVCSLNSLLSKKDDFFKFTDSNDIEEALNLFVNIFSININDYDYNTIKDDIDKIKQNIKDLVDVYRKEFNFNAKLICDMFDMMGNTQMKLQTRLPLIIWANKIVKPNYIITDMNVKLFNDDNQVSLKDLLGRIKNLSFHYNKIQKISDSSFFQHCNIITSTTIGTNDIVPSSTFAKQLQDSVKTFEQLYPHVINQRGFGLEVCDKKDECTIDLPQHQIDQKVLDMIQKFGSVVQESRVLLFDYLESIISMIHSIKQYKRIGEKINKILELFKKVIVQTTNNNLSIFKNIMILNIDRNLFKFANHFFIQQLKIDMYTSISIEKVLTNIANYYINNSANEYINIQEQDEKVIINLLLFIYMFTNILAETTSFFIPTTMINMLNIAIPVCMTNRNVVVCKDENIKNKLISNIEETSNHLDIKIFEYKDGKVIDLHGNKIEFKIDSSVDEIILKRV